MVWIHGGAFSWGTSTFYPSDILAAFNDVIVVTIIYRLGVLGFFNVPGTDVKGNYGMLDQVLALKWIQANIENFVGDPNRVTIFGESAGAMSVSLHLISPMSKGLFNKAIMQSGASSTPACCGKVTDTKQLKLFSIAVSCSEQPSLTECVARVPSEDILSAQNDLSFIKYSGRQDIAVPIVDKEFLPDLPENLFRAAKFHDNVDNSYWF
ncbi:pyrethroid hydrolase Ces2e-like [Montipora capricornis]|uniref:pyrethroid hydrolase Ces2e-like n=1 Tax=Montipora capricornis TaxID=246305 RepID=UPI0035F12A85